MHKLSNTSSTKVGCGKHIVRRTMVGSTTFRRDFLDFVVDATLFLAPVKSKGPSDSTGSGCRTFGATMTSA
jgi:hypothetical protein